MLRQFALSVLVVVVDRVGPRQELYLVVAVAVAHSLGRIALPSPQVNHTWSSLVPAVRQMALALTLILFQQAR
jgi:hypothetical protein